MERASRSITGPTRKQGRWTSATIFPSWRFLRSCGSICMDVDISSMSIQTSSTARISSMSALAHSSSDSRLGTALWRATTSRMTLKDGRARTTRTSRSFSSISRLRVLAFLSRGPIRQITNKQKQKKFFFWFFLDFFLFVC
jgi:hypothetical protein